MSESKTWRDRVSYIAPPTIKHSVGGEEHDFSPLSTSMLWKMKSIAPAIGRAIAKFFAVYGASQQKGDRTHTSKVVQVPDGGAQVENRDEAITPELARIRMDQASDATTELLVTILDSKNSALLGALIFDSARGVFPRAPQESEIKEFVDTTDVGSLVEWLTGVGKANQRVFAPLIQALTGKADAGSDSISASTTKKEAIPQPATAGVT